MSVSVFSNLRAKLREAIRDDFGIAWTDTDLDEIINEAQREYSLMSKALTGWISVTTTERNIYAMPDDFIEPIAAYDISGIEIPIYSWKYLNDKYPDFRKITGQFPQGVCFDLDGHGYCRVFPKLSAGQVIGQICYKRTASLNTLETRNNEALEQHSLFQLFLFSGKSSTDNYWSNFLNALNNKTGETKSNRSSRRGKYF